MQLTTEQKQEVAVWIEEGANLAEVQNRLGEKFDVRLTYMDTRFLIDDLKLTFKEPVVPVEPPAEPAAEAPVVDAALEPVAEPSLLAPESGAPSNVSVRVDSITRPGALVSGGVDFSDGKHAAWYLDQTGRLGMVPDEQGYRPPAADVAEFQRALERELAKLGI